jgi:hypothetical protein
MGVPRSGPAGPKSVQSARLFSSRPKGQYNNTEVCYVPLVVPKGVHSAQLNNGVCCDCLHRARCIQVSMVQSALYSVAKFIVPDRGDIVDSGIFFGVVVSTSQPMHPGGPVRQP